MGFLWAGEFLGLLKLFRVLGIRGGFGTGKTLLAVALAVEAWRLGWVDHVYSNLRLKGDWLEEIPGAIRGAAVIYDEAWQELDSRSFGAKASQRWLAYLRKRNVMLFLPSVIQVDVRFRTLLVQRFLGWGPLWVYRWQLNDGFKAMGGWFGLWKPLRVGKFYDHLEEPDTERGTRLGLALSGQLEGIGGTERELVADPDDKGQVFQYQSEGKRKG